VQDNRITLNTKLQYKTLHCTTKCSIDLIAHLFTPNYYE
jgi:hypothetical protein